MTPRGWEDIQGLTDTPGRMLALLKYQAKEKTGVRPGPAYGYSPQFPENGRVHQVDVADESIPLSPAEMQFIESETVSRSKSIVFSVFDCYDPDRYGGEGWATGGAMGYTKTKNLVSMAQGGVRVSRGTFAAVMLSTQLLQTLMSVEGNTPEERVERYLVQLAVAGTVQSLPEPLR